MNQISHASSRISDDDRVRVTIFPLPLEHPIRKATRLHPLSPLLIDPLHLILPIRRRRSLPISHGPIFLPPPVSIIRIRLPRPLRRWRLSHMMIPRRSILIRRRTGPPRPLGPYVRRDALDLDILWRRRPPRFPSGGHVAVGLAAAASPVARLAETGAALQLGDAGGIVALELGEAGFVEGFPLGALGAGFFDGFVGEDAGGDEDGCHLLFLLLGGGEGLWGGLLAFRRIPWRCWCDG